jgi:hypothetical protein
MRRIPALVTAAMLLSSAGAARAPAQPPPVTPPPQVEKPFAQGGSIYMDLSAGGYVVEGTAEPRIRIRWTTRDPADESSVRAAADVTGTQARIVVSGPSNGFEVRIEVPERSNMSVSLSAGDLVVGALDGDVDVSAWAGKMDVAVRNPAEYYSVRASVTAGQIRAEPFHTDKGGVFRSFSWEGKGRHSLRVRLTAGDVILRGAKGGQ